VKRKKMKNEKVKTKAMVLAICVVVLLMVTSMVIPVGASTGASISADDRDGESVEILKDVEPLVGDSYEDLTGIDILYDLYHGERDTGELSILKSDVTGRGATWSYNNLPITPTLLNDYKILLINEQDYGPSWSASELDAVKAWVSDGGGVFFNGDEIDEGMAVAGMFGISYGGPGCAGATTNIVPHYITEGVSSMTVPNPRTTMITTSPAYPIVYDICDNEMVAVSYYGEGKIVFFSDDMLRDNHIDEANNRIIANRAIDHLACYPDPWAEINEELDALIVNVSAAPMPNIIKQRLLDKLEYAKELKDNAKEECEAGNFDGATKKLGVAKSQVESFASMVKITRRISHEDKASFLKDSAEIKEKIQALIEYIETEHKC